MADDSRMARKQPGGGTMPALADGRTIDDVARDAVSEYEEIESGYMNSGDALFDAVGSALDNLDLDDDVEDARGNTELVRTIGRVYDAIDRLYPNLEVR